MNKRHSSIVIFFVFFTMVNAEIIKLADSVAVPVIPPAWSPQGDEIAFISQNGDLYTISVDGKNLRRLTHTKEYERNPSYTANGTYITTSYEKEIKEDSSISVLLKFNTFSGKVDSEATAEIPLPYAIVINSPYNIGTSALLAGTSFNKVLYVMREDSEPILISNNASENGPPVFSRDDEFVSYTSLENDIEQLAIVDLVMGEKKFLTDVLSRAYFPSFSPDGEQIIFTYNIDGNSDLWLINKDGSGLTQITETPYHENAPVWSPDGGKIAFVSNKDGEWALYIMDAPPLKLPPRQDSLIVENIISNSKILPVQDKLFYLASRTRFEKQQYNVNVCYYNLKEKTEFILDKASGSINDFIVSKSGNKVAYTLEDNSLWIINSDNTGKIQIATDEFYNKLGFFTPDEKKFIFISARSDDNWDNEFNYLDKMAIYVIDTDGSNLQQIDTAQYWMNVLDISKDGNLILFNYKLDDIYMLYLYDLKNNKKLKIADEVESAQFLPGDKEITFTTFSTETGEYAYYVSDLKGSNIKQLEGEPTWSYNGKRMVIDFDTTLVIIDKNGENKKVLWCGVWEDTMVIGTGAIYFSTNDKYVIFASELRKQVYEYIPINDAYLVEHYQIHRIDLLSGEDKIIFSSAMDPDAFIENMSYDIHGLTKTGDNVIVTKQDGHRSLHLCPCK